MCNKNTKFKTDMWANTKMKIINTLEERDMIFYVWFRLVNLATIVDDNGYLYITDNIPFTVNTLSIEFDRTKHDITLALNILLKLEMIEYIDERIFKVKNWTMYQKGVKASENKTDKTDKKEETVVIKNSQYEKQESIHDETYKQLNNIFSEIKPQVKENKMVNDNIQVSNIEKNYKKEDKKHLSEIITDNDHIKNIKTDSDKTKILNKNKKYKKKNKITNNKFRDDFAAVNDIREEVCFAEDYVIPKDEKVLKSFNFSET